MKSLINFAKSVGYKDIVLEVGSDVIEHYLEQDEESEEESEAEHDEESEEESEEEYEEESEEEYEIDIDQITTDISDLISEELWKKSVRHNTSGVPYYSFGSVYVSSILEAIISNETEKDPLPDIVDDEENGYGGYYYQKSKRASKQLIQYYESFGFREDPNVHKKLKCFSELPFPSLRLSL